MRLKRAKKFEEWLDLKPVTDEEFEELLNDPPKKEFGGKKSKTKKIKKREF
jgi:hypothetical protein